MEFLAVCLYHGYHVVSSLKHLSLINILQACPGEATFSCHKHYALDIINGYCFIGICVLQGILILTV